METFFKNTSWYKKITRGFIDTSEPKKKSTEKKMPLLQDILIRLNKIIDIGFITIIYFIMGAVFAFIITNFQDTFDSKKYDKKTLITSIFILIIIIWIDGVLIYIARNLIEFIPYPFDNLFGFDHKRVKELGATTAFTFVLLYYQPNLTNLTIYLKNRIDNTFEGRSFIEGIKLLNKPAITPTIMDDDKINKKKKKQEEKKKQEQE
jgi:predicted PurR-regulated permease PerM